MTTTLPTRAESSRHHARPGHPTPQWPPAGHPPARLWLAPIAADGDRVDYREEGHN